MANIIISEVVGKNYIEVDFGIYGGSSGLPLKKYFWTDNIYEVDVFSDRIVVELNGSDIDEWTVSTTPIDGGLVIDSVLGVTPTDNDHLAILIANLKG